MTVAQAIAWGENALSKAQKDDVNFAPKIFLQSILNCNSAQLYLKSDDCLNDQQIYSYEYYIEQRAKGCPVAYIIGEKEFYGLNFKVNPNVLIPRPETELIVDEVIAMKNSGIVFNSILDVGTGSGALAVTLKYHLPESDISAVDVSGPALAVAQENAKQHQCSIEFLQSNLLQSIVQSYDCIVSNLPYVPIEDKPTLSKEVGHEPNLALFAQDKGLALYKVLIEQAKHHVKPKGYFICEFGIHQSEAMQKIFEKNDFKVLKCVKDLSAIDRVIVAQKG